LKPTNELWSPIQRGRYTVSVQKSKRKILAVFSDVNSSPQLVAIFQKIDELGGNFRIILIGNEDAIIAKQIKALKWDLVMIPKRGKIGSLISFLKICIQVIRFKPQVLFASGQFATVIGIPCSKLLFIPHRIFIRHHSNLHHKYELKLGILLDKVTNHLATQIVAVSKVVSNILVNKENVEPGKIHLVYNGVDLERFHGSSLQRATAFSQDDDVNRPLNIGVVARLTEWKGVEYVAQAFVKLQMEYANSRLHIVGAYADSFPRVSKILSPLDPNSYKIESENSDIPSFLSGLDVFIHAPVGPNDEAFGIVYIEALASKTPCIFTSSGILNELENPGKYVEIVDYRNLEEIYLHLKEFIQKIKTAKPPVQDNWLKNFALDSMATEYSKILLGKLP
jgi:glycosyltransferase involved in cell wall biosynthesis